MGSNIGEFMRKWVARFANMVCKLSYVTSFYKLNLTNLMQLEYKT